MTLTDPSCVRLMPTTTGVSLTDCTSATKKDYFHSTTSRLLVKKGFKHRASSAPQRVARKLTPSLLSQGRPRMSVVGVPQLWTRRSVCCPQRGQEYVAWMVAPSRLSQRQPPSPLSRASKGRERCLRRSHWNNQKTRPRANAPPVAAAVPTGVMPPEVPGATRLPVVMRRGGRGLRTPSSVAQVSALAVASAPV